MNIFHGTKIQNSSRSITSLLLAFFVLSITGCAPNSSLRTTDPSQLTTETKMLLALRCNTNDNGVVIDTNSTDFPAILPIVEVNIRTYRDIDESLAAYKTFDFDYTNKTNPLLEKELFHQLEKVLQTHGLTRVKENPQITISMDFFVGKKEQYTPPKTITSTEIKNVWNTGMFGWDIAGFSQAVPVTTSTTTPGYTTTTYYSNIRLNFLNHAKLVEGEKLEKPPLIWMGEADHEGTSSDIRKIAPIMFGELVIEFPEQSAKAEKRYIRCFRYGGLGLGFNPSNWLIVQYVEPSSVAAEQGIIPGDILFTINGERVDNWPGYLAWSSANPWTYRSKDAYFRHVLSNRGNSDIELVIKSAEKKKRVTLRMRPRSGDHHLYVDEIGTILEKTKTSPM